jgi:hypothetical protein
MVHRLSLVVALLLVTAIPAAQLSFDHNLQRDPYRNLFGDPDAAQKTGPPADVSGRVTPEKPIVVCGMRILPADPTIDPKIRVGPRDRVVFDHKLRKLSPPICKPE